MLDPVYSDNYKGITQAILKEYLVYEPETGLFRWRNNLRYSDKRKAGTVAGCVTTPGYIEIGILGQRCPAHKLAFLYMEGRLVADSRFEIDHKDTVRSHNWWSNLRVATLSQNKANSRRPARNKLGATGIRLASLRRGAVTYTACIMREGTTYNLGEFSTREDAASAYIAKAKELDGEFFRDQ